MPYIENPKMQGSGLLDAIPQIGSCPVNCKDCFFQGGRSYLEPISKKLPNCPSIEMTKNRIVRMNAGGNDSNNQRELVEKTAQQFDNYFFNTAIPRDLEGFSGPVVLTINPQKMTDTTFYKLDPIPKNLMFVRIRANAWNVDKVIYPAISYYTKREIPVILTFMAYYSIPIPEKFKNDYIWKQRTTNSYWVLKPEKTEEIMDLFKSNIFVYKCTYKNVYSCKFCGNCLQFYYVTKERMR